MNAILRVTGLVLAYLVGSIPTGYLVTRQLKGIDVRTIGSGNVGATNVARMVGKGAGAFVLIMDMLKGLLSVTLLPAWIGTWSGESLGVAWRLWFGLAAVVGHDWSCWLQWRGGKGIATSLGVLLGLAPGVAGWCALVWFGAFAIFRMVSLSSVIASAALPLIVWIFGLGGAWLLSGFLLGGIAILRHKSNIERILQGEERKFTLS